MADNDNQTSEQEPVLPKEVAAEAGPISDIDPEKLALLRARLAAIKESEGKTVTGSEDPDAIPQSLDLSKFEVEPELEHFYKRATLETTPEGNKVWMVIEHQYLVQTGAWHIDQSGQPMGKNKQGKTLYHAKGLDHIITEIINGPEGVLSRDKGWRLSALLPGGGMSQGIAVFERQIKRVLPEPKPIVRPEEEPLEKTSDEELARMNDRAKAWQAEESGELDASGKEEPNVQSEE